MAAQSGLETFVRRLYGDRTFKDSALHNPDQAIAEYRLSGAEKVAARKLCLRMVTPGGVVKEAESWWN